MTSRPAGYAALVERYDLDLRVTGCFTRTHTEALYLLVGAHLEAGPRFCEPCPVSAVYHRADGLHSPTTGTFCRSVHGNLCADKVRIALFLRRPLITLFLHGHSLLLILLN